MALDKFKTPALPTPPAQYDKAYIQQLIRTLELVLSQWDSKTANHSEQYTADYFVAPLLDGYVKAHTTSPFTAATTIPVGDISGAGDITRVSDTNVTLTLGGTPVGSVLKSTSFTLGWSGQLAVGRGGTGVAALGDITKVDDTNVTLTLGGTPTGAVVTSTSFTLGWTGQLAVGRGGTGVAALGNITKSDDTNVTLTLGGTPNGAVVTSTSFTLGWTGTLALARGGTGASDASGARTNLGLGTAATQNTGTSGANLPFLNGTNVWSGVQDFSALPTLSSGGITFPSTQVPSADANTLDDYEEGTFTPTLTFGGGSTGMTFSTQVGRYTKIGRLVYLEIRLVLSAKGSSTGAAQIGSLPFSPSASQPGCNFATNYITMTTVTSPCATLNAGATLITLQDFTGSTTATLTDANFNDTSIIKLSGFYSISG